MRILHLIHSEGIYGAELVLLYLAREQQQRGHAVAVGSMRDPGTAETPFEKLARAWQVPVVPIRIAPRPTPAVIRALLQVTRNFGADVLHSHGYKANILLGALPRRLRAPMLTTLHGWTASRRLSALWAYERLDRWAIGRLEAVVVVTRSMLALPALRAVRAPRRHVVENGIPALEVRLHDLDARGAAAVPEPLTQFVRARPTWVAIGRLSAEKGFNILLEAFARARTAASVPQQLLIIGEGPERAALAHRIDTLGIKDQARLGGYVDGADRLLGAAAGFVMSSLTEGMPLVLLEALQWKVPILATAVGAIPEILGESGNVVPAGDLSALTQGLRAMMELPHARPLASAATDARYSSSRMADEYLRIYAAIT